MSWTNGTWADVAVGDTVLGGDGYPWSVTEKLVAVWNMESEPVKFYVTIERDGRAATRGELSTSKPVKYQKAEPAPADLGDDTQQCPDCLGPILKGGHECPPPKVVPYVEYVEYDDAERAAASALKGAGLTMTVIERVMTLGGLLEHLGAVHGEPALLETGKLTRIEYRSRLADLHFQLHAHDQERGQKWQPRGRTPHVHPVMDRPMEDAVPKSLRRR